MSDSVFRSASMETIKEAASNSGKALIVLNGAAAIAVLTKVGPEYNLINALLTYSWGASTGALLFATTYLSQYFFLFSRRTLGTSFQIAAISFFLIGFSCFILGGYFTASAMSVSVPECAALL